MCPEAQCTEMEPLLIIVGGGGEGQIHRIPYKETDLEERVYCLIGRRLVSHRTTLSGRL